MPQADCKGTAAWEDPHYAVVDVAADEDAADAGGGVDVGDDFQTADADAAG